MRLLTTIRQILYFNIHQKDTIQSVTFETVVYRTLALVMLAFIIKLDTRTGYVTIIIKLTEVLDR